jgi:hypothetical protein
MRIRSLLWIGADLDPVFTLTDTNPTAQKDADPIRTRDSYLTFLFADPNIVE